jgi:dTDP-4-dehydrorhamnose 3,5-epimerase
MIFHPLPLSGAYLVEMEARRDERGFFSRTFCQREFEEHGLKAPVVQFNASFNHLKGTVRGLHYQMPPAAEVKLLRCVRGAVFEVMVDMRPDSPTYLQYCGFELTDKNLRMLYIPELFAAGHQALTDNSEIAYHTAEFYTPGYERGVRYDDPAIGIRWPLPLTRISAKDTSWPLLKETAEEVTNGHCR